MTELPKAMKSFHLTLHLAQFCRRCEALADSLSVYLSSQPDVRAVTRLARLMTMAAWFSAAAFDSRDGAAAKITQLQNLRQDAGAALFEVGE